MNYELFNKCIAIAVADYQKMLLADFDQNPEYARLASKICSNGSIDLKKWVSCLEIESFNNRRYTGGAMFQPELLRFKDMDSIDHTFRYIEPSRYGQYHFFAKYEYDSYEELTTEGRTDFYLCDHDFVIKLDDLLLSALPDYKKKGGKRFFSNELSPNSYLTFDARKGRKLFSSIEGYIYPLLYLNYRQVDCYFQHGAIDTFSFFFLGYNSYPFFFNQNRDLSSPGSEPVVYRYEHTGKYALTNSLENLARFNKYIFLNVELYIHYFRLFEAWVRESLLPVIDADRPAGI